MQRKNSPGCTCCEPPICVHASADCGSSGTWLNHWYSQFRFVPDEASPLVNGTPWRSVYHAQLSEAFNLNAIDGFGLFTPQTLCGPTYDPAKRRWRGYTDSPPAEPDYAYRWHFEIESDQAMSVDPGAINCRRRFWVTDRQNNRLTDDFGMDLVPAFALPGVTDAICFNVEPVGDQPCGRAGYLVDFEYCMPKCVMMPPKSMKLSIEGLSSPNQGDMSGDYILEGGVKFPPNTGCPPNDPALGCPTITQAGILQQPNQCPEWAYGRVYSYMPAGNPWCITPDQVGTIGQIHFGGALVQIRYGVRYSSTFNCFNYYSARYLLSDPLVDPDQQGPLSIDWFGGVNTFHYWPPEIFGGQTDRAGCYFPPTLKLQFNSWT